MHFFILFASLLIKNVSSRSLPIVPSIVQFPSLSNDSFSIQFPPNSSDLPSNGWPKLPFRALVTEKKTSAGSEKTYMTIDYYLEPKPNNLKGDVIGNISNIETLIEGWGNPDYYVDNKRVFQSGLVFVRFPAVQARGAGRMTNGLAVQLLGAAWGLEYAFGPRGWQMAMIETVKVDGSLVVNGFFSLWIDESGKSVESD